MLLLVTRNPSDSAVGTLDIMEESDAISFPSPEELTPYRFIAAKLGGCASRRINYLVIAADDPALDP